MFQVTFLKRNQSSLFTLRSPSGSASDCEGASVVYASVVYASVSVTSVSDKSVFIPGSFGTVPCFPCWPLFFFGNWHNRLVYRLWSISLYSSIDLELDIFNGYCLSNQFLTHAVLLCMKNDDTSLMINSSQFDRTLLNNVFLFLWKWPASSSTIQVATSFEGNLHIFLQIIEEILPFSQWYILSCGRNLSKLSTVMVYCYGFDRLICDQKKYYDAVVEDVFKTVCCLL